MDRFVNDQPDDVTLLNKLTAGNEKAFRTLYDRHSQWLRRVAHSQIGDSMAADDAVAEIFIDLYERREQLACKNLRSWLYGAVLNKKYNFERSRKVRLKMADELLHSETTECGLENCYDVSKIEERLRIIFERLPDRTKKVFYLSRQQGLSYREIAKQLGISFFTVERYIVIALKVYRKELGIYMDALLLFVALYNVFCY